MFQLFSTVKFASRSSGYACLDCNCLGLVLGSSGGDFCCYQVEFGRIVHVFAPCIKAIEIQLPVVLWMLNSQVSGLLSDDFSAKSWRRHSAFYDVSLTSRLTDAILISSC